MTLCILVLSGVHKDWLFDSWFCFSFNGDRVLFDFEFFRCQQSLVVHDTLWVFRYLLFWDDFIVEETGHFFRMLVFASHEHFTICAYFRCITSLAVDAKFRAWTHPIVNIVGICLNLLCFQILGIVLLHLERRAYYILSVFSSLSFKFRLFLLVNNKSCRRRNYLLIRTIQHVLLRSLRQRRMKIILRWSYHLVLLSRTILNCLIWSHLINTIVELW